jgi:hypothetical protein
MATQLKSIVRFTGLVVGVPSVLPHGLNIDNVAQVPDLVAPSQGIFTIVADATNVTVTRTAADPAAVDVFCEVWHTEDRSFGPFGPSQPTGLVPRPFILRPGSGTSASISQAGITRWDGYVAPLDSATTDFFRQANNADAITTNVGQRLPGSVVGIYVVTVPLTGGTLTVDVVRFAGSTGAPIVLGAGTLELNLALNDFTDFAAFAQGLFTYNAGDSVALRYTTDENFSNGESNFGAVAAIWTQDD